LTNLCHIEYSKCSRVVRMQAWRRLRHWWATLCFTPTRTSIRRCFK